MATRMAHSGYPMTVHVSESFVKAVLLARSSGAAAAASELVAAAVAAPSSSAVGRDTSSSSSSSSSTENDFVMYAERYNGQQHRPMKTCVPCES